MPFGLAERKNQQRKERQKYINLCIAARRQPDQYGNTHAIWVSQSKEERENKAEKVYVGNGKEYSLTHSSTDEELPY